MSREGMLTVCAFNLHGKQENDGAGFPTIARELAKLRPDLCALQQVVIDGGKNTAERLAEMLGELMGEEYYTHFVECHLFYGRYLESVAILSRHPLKDAGQSTSAIWETSRLSCRATRPSRRWKSPAGSFSSSQCTWITTRTLC